MECLASTASFSGVWMLFLWKDAFEYERANFCPTVAHIEKKLRLFDAAEGRSMQLMIL